MQEDRVGIAETEPARSTVGLLVRSALLLGAGFASFVAASAAIRTVVPWPESLGLRAKTEVFLEHKDEYDAIYLGPSTVYRSFWPERIDPVVSEAIGRPFRSFNLGVGNLKGFEADAHLRHLLASEPGKLRWVFLQPTAYQPARMLIDQVRGVRCHDLEQTLAVLEALREDPRDLGVRANIAWTHLQAFGRWLSNYGLGPTTVATLFEGPDAPIRTERADLYATGGYREPAFLRPEIGDEFQGDPERYRDRVAALAGQRRTPRVSRSDLAFLRRQREVAAEAGVQIVYVLPPVVTRSDAIKTMAEAGVLQPFFDYQGLEHAKYYAIELKHDDNHFNRAGATVFSDDFARDLAAWMRSSEGD